MIVVIQIKKGCPWSKIKHGKNTIRSWLPKINNVTSSHLSLKRSHAFLTGNRVACKSVAWESFLFGSFPGKRFFTIQIKWLIYVYMIIWGLKSLVAPWLLLNFCLCSPILAWSYCEHRHFFFTRYYSIQGYTLSPNISSNFFNSLPIPSILVGERGTVRVNFLHTDQNLIILLNSAFAFE